MSDEFRVTEEDESMIMRGARHENMCSGVWKQGSMLSKCSLSREVSEHDFILTGVPPPTYMSHLVHVMGRVIAFTPTN